jgi:hypothetical protein
MTYRENFKALRLIENSPHYWTMTWEVKAARERLAPIGAPSAGNEIGAERLL